MLTRLISNAVVPAQSIKNTVLYEKLHIDFTQPCIDSVFRLDK